GPASAASLPSLDASGAPATLTAPGPTLSASRTEDGTTDLTGDVTSAGLNGSETLTYSAATASDAHVATAGKYISAITLADGTGTASNYSLPSLDAAGAPVTITAKGLTPTLINTGVTKTYDGHTSAPVGFVPLYSIAGLIAGDVSADLSHSGAAYNDANVPLANMVTVSGLTLDGITGSNGSHVMDYVLDASSKSVAATITPAALTVRPYDDAKFVTQGDSAGYAGVSYSGFVNGETQGTASGLTAPTVTRTTRGPDGNTAGPDSLAGTYSGQLIASGGGADNYSLSYQVGDYTIVPSDQLLIRVTNLSNIYGSTVPYQISSVEYFDGAQVVRLDDGSVAGSSVSLGAGNQVSINDGAAGAASFTLTPQGAVTSGAGKLAVGTYQLGASGPVTENSVNFSDTITVTGTHQVSAKAVTANASAGVSKVYDGTSDMTGVTLQLAGLEGGDLVTVNGAGAYGDRNAGTGKSFTISGLSLSGTDAANYFLSGGGSFSGTNGVITPKGLTTAFTASDKVYDGNRSVNVTGHSADIVAGDLVDISQGGALFSDKNVGTGKDVTVSGIAISGADAGNYTLLDTTAGTTASISRLNSVTWVGGSSGNWFDPANWAGGAVPDLSNVANVIIPGGVDVSFGTALVAPAEAGPVNIDSLGSGGSVTQSAGELNIGSGGMTLAGFSQSGGATTSSGDILLGSFAQSGGSLTTTNGADLTVTGEYGQSGGGTVSVSGDIHITDNSGGTTLGNITTGGALSVTSTDGAITQSGGSALIIGGQTRVSARHNGLPANITVDGNGNNFGGAFTANGANITVTDWTGLTLGHIIRTGWLIINGRLVTDDPGDTTPAAIRRQISAWQGATRNFNAPLSNRALPPAISLEAIGRPGLSVRREDVGETTWLSVALTQDIPGSGTRFSFRLPNDLAKEVARARTPSVTLANGHPLPDWLRFDPATGQFTADRAPPGGLPIEVVINLPDDEIRVTVTQGAQGAA
ncbi:MAG: beta strand repeat-containing protein, partial [Tropicimonas sp.]|uniref:beta strand repeat-containing protein n=1 Tax=Tropicimonas sp. TaxID=2067044 RepID=UPI003A83E4EA